jgi:radical SAM superfamily enzyme
MTSTLISCSAHQEGSKDFIYKLHIITNTFHPSTFYKYSELHFNQSNYYILFICDSLEFCKIEIIINRITFFYVFITA